MNETVYAVGVTTRLLVKKNNLCDVTCALHCYNLGCKESRPGYRAFACFFLILANCAVVTGTLAL